MQKLPSYTKDDEEAFELSTYGIYTPIKLAMYESSIIASLIISIESDLLRLHQESKDKINYRKYDFLLDSLHSNLYLIEQIIYHFPLSKFSPYITLYIQVCSEFIYRFNSIKSSIKITFKNADDNPLIDIQQEFLNKLRDKLNTVEFRKQIEQHRKSISKNKQSLLRYINSLFNYRSRLLVLRVDFSYKSDYGVFILDNGTRVFCDGHDDEDRRDLKQWGVEVREHRDELIKYLREKYKDDFVGYVWKIEYGADKGFHLHTIIFLDGSKYRQDISIAQEIGEAWKFDITLNKGIYWNCNAQKKNFEKNNRVATGMIEHDNNKLRENLNKMACYLVKQDYFARTILGNNRSFGKGEKPKKVKSGRPRLTKE